MLACGIHGAKDLRVEERPAPVPAAGDVLVRFGAGGICGSDLHYYHDGGVGDFRLREPMVLGHEVAGEVAAVGAGVDAVREGDRVAVDPARPCRDCPECLAGHANLCRRMRFFGSAARFPHVPGAFAEFFTAADFQCVPVSATLPLRVAACAEPLAVALHAVARAGDAVLGGRALVTGAGPIGVLVAAAARAAGAAEVVVTDLLEEPLTVARAMGATATCDTRARPEEFADTYERGRGVFDVAFEAAGNARALGSCLRATRPGGRVVQIGILPAGDAAVPINLVTSKELELRGTFRFHREFGWAVRCLTDGRVDVSPMLSAKRPLSDAVAALELAADRCRVMKVSLSSL